MLKNSHALLIAALTVLASLFSLPADADTRITEQAYAEDVSGTLDFEKAQKLPFQPFIGAFAKGYSHSTFWIRLKIEPQGAKAPSKVLGNSIVLRIRPPYLREIEVFDPKTPTTHRRLSGDLHPSSGDEYRSFNLNFVLETMDASREIYIRLKTSSSTMSFFEAYHLYDLQEADQNQTIFFSIYLFFLFVTFVLAVIFYRIDRDCLFAAYALKQFSYILWAVAVFGIYRYYTDNLFIPSAVYMCGAVVCVTLASQMFDVLFFKDLGAPKALLVVMVALMGLPIIGVFFLTVGDFMSGMRITLLTVFVFPIVTAVGAFFVRKKNVPETIISHALPSWVIISAYGLIAVLLIVSVLPQLGLFSGTSFSLYSNVAHSIVSSIILISVLLYRMALNRKKEGHVRLALFDAEQNLIREQSFGKERDMLMSMLTHELQTPLAAIQMSIATKNVQYEKMADVTQAVQDINSILSRCLDASRIEANTIHPVLSDVDMVSLVQDLIKASSDSHRYHLDAVADVQIRTDQGLLQIILLNILENAQRYSLPKKEIRVHLCPLEKQDGVEITVVNCVPNGEWPDIEKLFNKFYRGTHAHRVSGSGLGLYIVKALVEKIGGRITCEKAEPDICFRLVLPC
jgi:signal transduction histidine kinase